MRADPGINILVDQKQDDGNRMLDLRRDALKLACAALSQATNSADFTMRLRNMRQARLTLGGGVSWRKMIGWLIRLFLPNHVHDLGGSLAPLRFGKG